jgi:NAD(P)-dependent dehydrogenase (short-subunit alcohol dehydrogenase family)
MTDAADVSMRGRLVLVTGGTDGIGLHTARELAGRGADVILTGRDERRGLAAADRVDAEAGRRAATFIRADHATVGGNQRVAQQVRDRFAGLDVLVNNVGGLYDTRWETADGYEATLAMNLVGPVALTGELVPVLRARIVFVVSAAFALFRGDPFEDVQSSRRYVPADAYNRAKLLNLLAGLALARRLADEGITVNAVHPGLAWTTMTRSMSRRTVPMFRYVWPLVRLVQRGGSPEKAGRRVARLAAASDLTGRTGAYFDGGTGPKRLSPRELDLDAQERAWRLATGLVDRAPTGVGVQDR